MLLPLLQEDAEHRLNVKNAALQRNINPGVKSAAGIAPNAAGNAGSREQYKIIQKEG